MTANTTTADSSDHASSNESAGSSGPTRFGLAENLCGLLCYALGFISGIAFLLLEKKNGFVRFHAMQSTITFVALLVVNIPLGFVLGFIPVVGPLLSMAIGLAMTVLWVFLMVKAYRGERYHLPRIGEIAAQKVAG